MSVIRFLPAGILLLLLTPRAWALGPEETWFHDSLVKVVLKWQSTGIVYEDRFISEPRVLEVMEFNGVVLDSKGHVATWVGNSFWKLGLPNGRYYLQLADGKAVPANLIGVDERLALAVLKASVTLDQPVTFGNSLHQRELTFISLINGNWGSTGLHVLKLLPRKPLPETEMRACPYDQSSREHAVNGSMVFDPARRLVGIVTDRNPYPFSKKVESYRIVPVGVIRDSVKTILESHSNLQAGWLGVFMDDSEKNVIRIRSVIPGSPAERAGLRSGDTVLRVDGQQVETMSELSRIIRWTGPRHPVAMRVSREGRLLDLKPVLGSRPVHEKQVVWALEIPRVWRDSSAEKTSEGLRLYPVSPPRALNIGLVVESMTPQLAEFFQSPRSQGLLVKSVLASSPADRFGFQAGDVLVEINGSVLTSADDIDKALEMAEDGLLTIKVVRKGKVQTRKVALN